MNAGASAGPASAGSTPEAAKRGNPGPRRGPGEVLPAARRGNGKGVSGGSWSVGSDYWRGVCRAFYIVSKIVLSTSYSVKKCFIHSIQCQKCRIYFASARAYPLSVLFQAKMEASEEEADVRSLCEMGFPVSKARAARKKSGLQGVHRWAVDRSVSIADLVYLLGRVG